MLTDRQKFALNWLHLNRQSRLRWMRNGKSAYGSPDTWDAFEIVGPDGSIRIATADWEALRPFKMISGPETGKAFVPNDAGMAELLHSEPPCSHCGWKHNVGNPCPPHDRQHSSALRKLQP